MTMKMMKPRVVLERSIRTRNSDDGMVADQVLVYSVAMNV